MQFDQTIIHSYALVFTILMGITVLFINRKYVLIPIIITAIFISLQQRIAIMGFDFTMLRLLILVGWCRAILRSENSIGNFNILDKLVIWWVLARTITYSLLWMSPGAFINRLGGGLDVLGLYFLVRVYVKGYTDLLRLIKVFLILCIPLSFAMLIEWKTGRNLFSVFGGVPEITFVRDGRMRCQGAFQHPILAGTFAASLIPFCIAFIKVRNPFRKWAVISFIAISIVTFTTSSSGPVLTYMAGIGAFWGAWKFRNRMYLVRRLMVITLIALQIVMQAPIYAIIMRVKVFPSSTGYHRYFLIDNFIKRINEWWLLGSRGTAHWGGHAFDITNEFILVGVNGGLLTLILYVAIIVYCFKSVGLGYHRIKNDNPQIFGICIWALGVSLFAHIVSFFGVSYFDQTIVVWYCLIGMISTASGISEKPTILDIDLHRVETVKQAGL